MRWPSLGEAKSGSNSLHWAKAGDFLWVPHDWSCPSPAHTPLPWQPDADCGGHTLPRGVGHGGPPCRPAQTEAASGTGRPESPWVSHVSATPSQAQSSPRAEARDPRGPPVRCWKPPGASALDNLLWAQDPEGLSWGQLCTPRGPRLPCLRGLRPAGVGRHRALAQRARVGLLVPSSRKEAAQVGGRGGRGGRELREPSPHARRKCGRTHGRNPGAGPGSWGTGPEVPQAAAAGPHPREPPPLTQTLCRVPGPTPNCPIKGRHPFNSTGNLWGD